MRRICSITAFILFSFLVWGTFDLKVYGDTIKALDPVEVKEYKGEKLGSSADFRENSIKGPQHIDISKYQLIVNGLVAKPENYTYPQLMALPNYQKIVTLNCVEGWSVKALSLVIVWLKQPQSICPQLFQKQF